jgi:hypothetical protein
MIILRNKNYAYVEDFNTLEELNEYLERNKLDKNDYIIQYNC